MKKKVLIFLLLTALIMSSFIINSQAKEIDSLAEIAALSKLEPIGSKSVNAYTELADVKASNLPASYSSRDLGYTTHVRQQSANICWAYSSLASLETLLLKSGEKVEHFSPEHMNIWGSMEEDGTGWQREDLVSDGGYSYIPMGYLTSWNGPLLDKELPVGSDKEAYNNANSLYSTDYGVTEIRYVNRDTPIETVKSYVMEYGAVVANFNADTVQYMNSTSDGFYCSDGSLPTSALYGHAISIVGWDDNYPKENFSTSYSGDTPDNNGAWLIKNSWGSYVNTNGGYFWISYEDAWLFHSIFGPSFAIADYEKLDSSQAIYQNEVYGATTQFSYLTDESGVAADKITYVNVFDFSNDFPVLDKVLFESTSYDADYTVYYIPVFGGKPTQETYLWQELSTGTVDYTGYITVDVDDFELPEGMGAIGISVDNTRTYNENKDKKGYEYIPNSLGVCEWLAYSGGYYFKNQGETGESYVMYTDQSNPILYDLMDFYDKYFDDPMGATFVIKAITKNPDFTPDPTATQVTPTETTEEITTQSKAITLGITLEYIGNTRLNVIASASGGSGEYTYEFSVNGEVIQSYSEQNYIALSLDTDGSYTVEISVKDSGGRVLSTQSVTTVEDGKIVIPGENTDPTETITAPTETTNTVATQIAKAYIMGDVDYNGNISIKDATLIRKHLAKITDFDEITLMLSDVDSSGGCSIKDATLIQKYIALIDTPSNVGQTVMLTD
ncbi:MAG: hypothetical protein IJ451_06735 [Ruminococcus sp.]|nr:hypothetical protein [Ruminococcus sp.]